MFFTIKYIYMWGFMRRKKIKEKLKGDCFIVKYSENMQWFIPKTYVIIFMLKEH